MGVYIKKLQAKKVEAIFAMLGLHIEDGDIIEVTEPHGRLIDADEALHHFTLNMNWSDEDGYPINDWEERESILKDFVDGVSTVIEAEGE